MKTAVKAESGTAAKPAESTASAHVEAPKATPMSSDGIASLIMGEFKADAESEADKEVRSAEESATAKSTEAAQTTDETPEDGSEVDAKPDEDKPTEEGKEAEEEPAPEEGKEADDDKTALPEHVQKIVDKRIGKIVAQREEEKTKRTEAEAQAAQLRAEVERLKAQPAAPVPAVEVPNEEKLNEFETTATAFTNVVEAYLDDSATPEERDQVDRFMASRRLDANGLKRQLREARNNLRSIPQQRQQLAAFRAQEAQAAPLVEQYFPFLKDTKTPEYAQAQEVFRVMPELRQRTPMHQVVAGVYVLGLRKLAEMRQAESKPAAVKPVIPSKPPVKPPSTSTAAPAKSSTRSSQEEAARTRFEKAPTRNNAVELALIGLRSF